MTVVDFPGEYLTKEDRERERWLGTAFCAVAIADLSADDRQEFLAELLRTRFSDAPDEKPTTQDDPAWPAYAVRFLLEVLTDKTGYFAEVGRMAKDEVFRDLGIFKEGTRPPDES